MFLFTKLRNHTFFQVVIILFLGFCSGLPLALTGQSLQAWLSVENIDIATIGFFSLVGLPYTFKFLWAPLMDRFDIPFIGRRKGWLVLTQVLIACCLFVMSSVGPMADTKTFAILALLVAFFSASQDIVIDAFRTDYLAPEKRGLGASMVVLGYRLAMILSGGIAFTWADPNGNNWSWSKIYLVMAQVMFVAAVVSMFFLPLLSAPKAISKTSAKKDILGFLALVVSVVVGYQLTVRLATPACEKLISYIFSADNSLTADLKKWSDLLGTYIGILITVPLAWWSVKKVKFETLVVSLENYFSVKGAVGFLVLIILYKLGDAFAGALTTTFLLKGVGFSSAEVGVVNKVIGIWLTIFGSIFGGLIMIRIGLYRSLMVFSILQLLSNLGFWQVAVAGKGAWGHFDLPAFNLVIVSLKETAQVDNLLLFAVAVENITGGMGTAALVALLTSLCNQKFSATQYALLSSLAAIGRIWVGPLAGVLVSTIGWPQFFIFSVFMALPGVLLLYKMKSAVTNLDVIKVSSSLDD
jgi:PAT family beta-lactamase induction signal transducer AmpG